MQVPRWRCGDVVDALDDSVVVVGDAADKETDEDDDDDNAYMAAASNVVARNGNVTYIGGIENFMRQKLAHSHATGRQGFTLGVVAVVGLAALEAPTTSATIAGCNGC